MQIPREPPLTPQPTVILFATEQVCATNDDLMDAVAEHGEISTKAQDIFIDATRNCTEHAIPPSFVDCDWSLQDSDGSRTAPAMEGVHLSLDSSTCSRNGQRKPTFGMQSEDAQCDAPLRDHSFGHNTMSTDVFHGDDNNRDDLPVDYAIPKWSWNVYKTDAPNDGNDTSTQGTFGSIVNRLGSIFGVTSTCLQVDEDQVVFNADMEDIQASPSPYREIIH